MDKEIKQYVNNFVQKIVDGNFSWNIYNVNQAAAKTLGYDTERISQASLACKRNGEYSDAANGYLAIIHCTADITGGVIPPEVCRNLAKVLLASNDYYDAYVILFYIHKVLRMYQDCLDDRGQYLLQQVSFDVNILYRCAQTKNLNMLFNETKNYSGNPYYQFEKTEAAIIKELKMICDFVD